MAARQLGSIGVARKSKSDVMPMCGLLLIIFLSHGVSGDDLKQV